jgi:hypothetical protein
VKGCRPTSMADQTPTKKPSMILRAVRRLELAAGLAVLQLMYYEWLAGAMILSGHLPSARAVETAMTAGIAAMVFSWVGVVPVIGQILWARFADRVIAWSVGGADNPLLHVEWSTPEINTTLLGLRLHLASLSGTFLSFLHDAGLALTIFLSAGTVLTFVLRLFGKSYPQLFAMRGPLGPEAANNLFARLDRRGAKLITPILALETVVACVFLWGHFSAPVAILLGLVSVAVATTIGILSLPLQFPPFAGMVIYLLIASRSYAAMTSPLPEIARIHWALPAGLGQFLTQTLHLPSPDIPFITYLVAVGITLPVMIYQGILLTWLARRFPHFMPDPRFDPASLAPKPPMAARWSKRKQWAVVGGSTLIICLAILAGVFWFANRELRLNPTIGGFGSLAGTATCRTFCDEVGGTGALLPGMRPPGEVRTAQVSLTGSPDVRYLWIEPSMQPGEGFPDIALDVQLLDPSGSVVAELSSAEPLTGCMASENCFYRRVIPFTAAQDGIYRLRLTPQTWGISAIRVTLHARVE